MTQILTAIYPSLKDRVVYITGGGTGIGASLTAGFAAQGAKVAFVDIAEEPSRALAEQIGAQTGRKPLYLPCDLRDIAALRATIAQTQAELGEIDVLVNNAANDQRHKIEEVTPEFWDERMAVNLRPQFFTAQAVAESMKARKSGSIINFGSSSWKKGQGGMPAYTAAKAAIHGLTRGLARDLGPYNVRVNTIVPGWIITERQLALWLTPEADAERARQQCLPERVMPDHVTAMALFLAADDSAACSAQEFTVDGGWI
ncbi:SDR family NAD(P)-dependent oxidoreductase [Acidocella aminolytica]|jgi:NAD(P)-dependent dehydrogenase (short-subunit alcohol dehydrogenase family)|uniref:Oxidoreductase/short-chain dehydrogenase/reductase SDR n=1 Tax=Acidocella aminolytica 101 = DSM 11237 TaxID=1120923 RepID=A0A0D6PE85_9PROT|nr:SDR family oxidoreductase [Acidocella aminolytica]GAN79159.1 oxidoreductase/short-chain dehydrogenase/reductase SDR [Acidocella aminolytica 101 = DSM 11237]GBQ43651.1 putative oxidoreductase [Acidocella aminolytica 101 = DSM 11237]SHE66988.1 NAD(P)-dependent dehydrogenase, short-chain alcohol dehydrogenase family [Acidocella aminolytica 101 = DSM 11237]